MRIQENNVAANQGSGECCYERLIAIKLDEPVDSAIAAVRVSHILVAMIAPEAFLSSVSVELQPEPGSLQIKSFANRFHVRLEDAPAGDNRILQSLMVKVDNRRQAAQIVSVGEYSALYVKKMIQYQPAFWPPPRLPIHLVKRDLPDIFTLILGAIQTDPMMLRDIELSLTVFPRRIPVWRFQAEEPTGVVRRLLINAKSGAMSMLRPGAGCPEKTCGEKVSERRRF